MRPLAGTLGRLLGQLARWRHRPHVHVMLYGCLVAHHRDDAARSRRA